MVCKYNMSGRYKVRFSRGRYTLRYSGMPTAGRTTWPLASEGVISGGVPGEVQRCNVIYGRYTFVDTDGIYRIPPTYYAMPL